MGYYSQSVNPLGPETPTLHICAAVSCSLYALASKMHGEDVFPEVHTATMALVGCTCGLSAVFNTPIGGILFALEEYAL